MGVKRHIIEDFMNLNDPDVVSAMLGGVVLSLMIRQAGITSWPILWFSGLTGSGKSLLASLAMNFHGDFGPQGSGRFISWTATGNAIQSAGYDFRDLLFLVDDYKRDDVKHSSCVMVLQCYADRSGRSPTQIRRDENNTRPIRGLLVSTGEDFPESNASGRGRRS